MYEYYLTSDLVEGAMTEDGCREILLAVYLYRELRDGSRDRAYLKTVGTVAEMDEMEAVIDEHVAAVDAADDWSPCQACYGSEAYQRDGWEEKVRAWERVRG